MRKLKEATKKLLRSNDRLLDLLMPSRRKNKQKFCLSDENEKVLEIIKSHNEIMEESLLDKYVPIKFDKKTNTIIISAKLGKAEIHITPPPKDYKQK